MSDVLTPEQRHRNMAAIHSVPTKPELKLRNALWHLGFRYKVNDKRLPGKPDIVLPKYRTAIFVHGCFWHGHKGCKDSHTPNTNTDYWTSKITRNQQRDQDVWRQLEAKGWSVIIIWECELKTIRLQKTIDMTVAAIRQNGESHRRAQDLKRLIREEYQQQRKQQKAFEATLKEEILKQFPKD